MGETERAAYMAAAIDGEGSILISRQAVDETRKSPRFSYDIKVVNTERQWLETLQGWFGGTIYEVGRTNSRNRKRCYSLQFTGDDARRLLAIVMPYLLMKRPRAELMLQFFEVAARRAASSRAGKPAEPSIVAEQQTIWARLAELNRRGVGPLNLRGGEPPIKSLCTVDGCERKHYGRGYCWMHYRKYIVRGGTAYYEKKCVQCGREFVARRSDTECCSQPCNDKKHYALNREARLARAKAYRARKKLEKTSSA
jgi:hypothetical protein